MYTSNILRNELEYTNVNRCDLFKFNPFLGYIKRFLQLFTEVN